MTADPVFPSPSAWMVAAPTATPVTTPLELTVATPGVLLDQTMVRPVSTFPSPSIGSATSVVEAPTVMLAAPGTMRMSAMGRRSTVTAMVRDCPPLEAAICAVPGDTAVTVPAWSMVTTLAFCVDQKTLALGRSASFSS